MSKQKKNNVISLWAYRKKKQKQVARKAKKAASDKNDFFIEEKNNTDTFKEAPKTAHIYYMHNYLKTKKLPPSEEEKNDLQIGKHEIQERKNTIDLSTYRPMNKKPSNQKQNFVSKLISIENYRQLKNKKAISPYYSKYAKEAVSFAAIALMMLFALNVFFPDKGLFDLKKGQPQYAQNTEADSTSFQADRKIASPNKPLKKEIRKDKRPENQQAFFGEKPDSSDYTGF